MAASTYFCIGRNYADHAREMGHDPEREPPFFTKPLSSLCPAEGDWHLPDFSKQVEHEVELVLALKSHPARPPCECRRRQGLDRRRRLGY